MQPLSVGTLLVESFAPPEFVDLARDPGSLTAVLARSHKVSIASFCNWRWQMGQQITTAAAASPQLALSESEVAGFSDTATAFVSGITPYYLGLMNPAADASCPIRQQALPRREEGLQGVGSPDPLAEQMHSPVKEVVQAYPDRVAFCVAQLCPVYCRYCFRKRRDEEEGLHFNRRIIARGLAYIRSRPAIRDVLITGGDPFIASDSALESLVQELRQIPHVQIIRFGTRTPVTLPYRVTNHLGQRLARYQPLYVNTHFNCAEEITPEATRAVANLVDNGIPVANQAVLLRGVNDSVERMQALLLGLLRIRVRPYYLFHAHPVAGTDHLRVDLAQGLAIMKALRGRITGLAIPQFIVDTPSGKVPLLPEHVLGRDGNDLLLNDLNGEIHREVGAFGSWSPQPDPT